MSDTGDSDDGGFEEFPVSFDRITEDNIKAAFENGGADFTNLIVATLLFAQNRRKGTNLTAEGKAKLEEIINIGEGFYHWDDIAAERTTG